MGGEERFFLPTGGSCTCGKRRKRQAPGEDDPTNTRFIDIGGLLGGGNNNQHCGSCCYGGYNNGYNNGGYNNGYNNGGYNNNNQCQCNNQLTFQDQYGNIH